MDSTAFDYWTYWTQLIIFWLPCGCFIFKLSVLIFFIFNFFKRDSIVRNKYFYLLFAGFFWDVLTSIIEISDNLCQTYYGTDNCFITSRMVVFFKWHNCQFASSWSLTLTLNRLTSVVWFSKHDEIWSKKHFIFFVLLLFAFPFIINGYSFPNYKCRFNLNGCENYETYWSTDSLVTAIANGMFSVSSLFVAIFTAFMYHKKVGINNKGKSSSTTKNNNKNNAEQKLIFHAGITSFSYIIHLWFFSYVWYLGINDSNLSLMIFIASISYDIYHISPYVLLFIFSQLMRKAFLEFYHLSCFLPVERTTRTRILPAAFVTKNKK